MSGRRHKKKTLQQRKKSQMKKQIGPLGSMLQHLHLFLRDVGEKLGMFGTECDEITMKRYK